MADEFRLRRATSTDATAVFALIEATSEAPSWPKSAWDGFLDGLAAEQRLLLLADDTNGETCGLLVATSVAGETELESLLVSSRYRRRGAGRALLTAWLEWAARGQARRAFLEVRASNRAAVRLYESLDFQVTGLRSSYYNDPPEDALLMARQVVVP